jgi:hypothetical protein
MRMKDVKSWSKSVATIVDALKQAQIRHADVLDWFECIMSPEGARSYRANEKSWESAALALIALAYDAMPLLTPWVEKVRQLLAVFEGIVEGVERGDVSALFVDWNLVRYQKVVAEYSTTVNARDGVMRNMKVIDLNRGPLAERVKKIRSTIGVEQDDPPPLEPVREPSPMRAPRLESPRVRPELPRARSASTARSSSAPVRRQARSARAERDLGARLDDQEEAIGRLVAAVERLTNARTERQRKGRTGAMMRGPSAAIDVDDDDELSQSSDFGGNRPR